MADNNLMQIDSSAQSVRGEQYDAVSPPPGRLNSSSNLKPTATSHRKVRSDFSWIQNGKEAGPGVAVAAATSAPAAPANLAPVPSLVNYGRASTAPTINSTSSTSSSSTSTTTSIFKRAPSEFGLSLDSMLKMSLMQQLQLRVCSLYTEDELLWICMRLGLSSVPGLTAPQVVLCALFDPGRLGEEAVASPAASPFLTTQACLSALVGNSSATPPGQPEGSMSNELSASLEREGGELGHREVALSPFQLMNNNPISNVAFRLAQRQRAQKEVEEQARAPA